MDKGKDTQLVMVKILKTNLDNILNKRPLINVVNKKIGY